MKKSPLNTSLSLPAMIRRALGGWLMAAAVEVLLLPQTARSLSGLTALSGVVPMRMALTAAAVILLFTLLARFFETDSLERWWLTGSFAALAALSLHSSFSIAFLAACLLVLGILLVYAIAGWNAAPAPRPINGRLRGPCAWITAGLALLFFLFVCGWTVGRVWSFSTPSYDFGIFAQMFHHMKTSGLPLTTLERDGLLSHFHVHMSPVYYLMLPFYWLFPYPATLQVLQAAVLASAVIPLWKLGRRHGLSPLLRMALCAMLLLYPAFSGGTSYDLHENCFLTPLILWLLYGIDREKPLAAVLSAMLTLTVKEDAAVYVAVIALWWMLRTLLRPEKHPARNLLTGGIMLALSLIWFFLVTRFLATQGDGVMTYRYQNFMYDGSSSLISVVKAVLRNPMKAVYECMDPEKLPFLALTLLPLLGLPLWTRRFERYLLLIPYVLINLMSDYPYQHDIFFQYTFGSTACLFYLTAVNLADWKPNRRMGAAFLASLIAAGCFATYNVPKAMTYPRYCIRYQERYQHIRETLSRIPEDASVSATTFYTTFLSRRDTLYDIRYASRAHLLETEYVVLNMTAENDYKAYVREGLSGFESMQALLRENGYEEFARLENVLVIWRKVPQ